MKTLLNYIALKRLTYLKNQKLSDLHKCRKHIKAQMKRYPSINFNMISNEVVKPNRKWIQWSHQDHRDNKNIELISLDIASQATRIQHIEAIKKQIKELKTNGSLPRFNLKGHPYLPKNDKWYERRRKIYTRLNKRNGLDLTHKLPKNPLIALHT